MSVRNHAVLPHITTVEGGVATIRSAVKPVAQATAALGLPLWAYSAHVGSFVSTGAFEAVLESMQQENCICLPTIHRPGALFKDGQGQYGIFKYIDKEAATTGKLFDNHRSEKYHRIENVVDNETVKPQL